jgi:UDP-2-acetamido-3-amino-2,3-dideoxy-glucuronate N-acetyltransferase
MIGNLKVAHIGAGNWGKNIIRNLHELKVLQVICDSNRETLDKFKKLYPDAECTDDFETVLSDPSIDAVSVATPAATHFENARAALKAGKDVFVEKPLALHAREGEELSALADSQDSILMVGHILRFHPAIDKIKQLIHEGQLGRVRSCYSHRLNLGKVRTEENILWSFAPHDISVLNYLLDGPPSEINASGQVILQPDIHDVTLTVMKWTNGTMAHIYLSWLHPFKEHRLVVVGDKAMVVFDDTKPDDKLVLYDRGIDFIKGEPVKREEDVEVVAFDDSEPLRNEMEHFLDCVANRKRPRTDANEAIAVLRVLRAAQNALQSGSMTDSSINLGYHAHPSAAVDEGAAIGKGTKIWHYSHIMPKVKIGENCSLGQNVFVANNVTIGNNVKIQNNVSVYEGVILEDNTFCGPSMVFTNVKNPRSAVPRNTSEDYLATHIKKGATLGANCTVVCGATIGENAFVAAGAVVTKDVKPSALVAGVPARRIGWMCDCGFKLEENETSLLCAECGNKFRLREGTRLVPEQ